MPAASSYPNTSIPEARVKIFALCKLAEVGVGTVKQIEVHEASYEPFALFNVEGRLHLTDDTCTHGFASLSLGEVKGHTVHCPLHGGAFDITSGEPCELPCTLPIKCYRVWVEGETVVSDLTELTPAGS
jgi:nitrite reductase/ring-hydroxylating ferredoxin subunit